MDFKSIAVGSAQKLVHILFAKCPMILGLLQKDYVKLFLNDPLMQFQLGARQVLKIGLITLLLIMLAPLAVYSSDEGSITQPEYVNFWSDYKNIFLFQPKLVKTVFNEIIDLKSNNKAVRRLINYEVLGCQSEVSYNAGCRIDQLKLQRKKSKLSSRYTIPANFTGISFRPYKNQKTRSLVMLSWRPALFRPPLIEVDTFLDYINAARNSKIYTLKSGLEWVQIVPDFQKRIEIVVDRVMANNLMKIYQHPHNDFRDSIIFMLDSTHSARENGLSSTTLYLKAVSVKINHRIYRVQKDSTL
jgi:hypothetical protein